MLFQDRATVAPAQLESSGIGCPAEPSCLESLALPLRGGPMLASYSGRKGLDSMSEIIFEVREDEADGGYTASALGYGIHTQGDTLEELRSMVRSEERRVGKEGRYRGS